MRTTHAVLAACAVLASPPAGLTAQDHRHAEDDAHGEVHFAIGCAPAVQTAFDSAVALLHSYAYEDSRRRFLAVAEQDPACGIAWWGVAMTHYQATWPQPMPDLAGGRAAAEKAAELGGKSKREQAYIDAIQVLYRDTERTDHRTRARAYSEAMQKLSGAYPDDLEASIFYALSLLGAAAPGDTTYTYQKNAADVLNRLAPAHPRHPGIVHYTIHAFDYPQLAELALPAAQIYARIAPGVPHALHMPSHIFTRLGLWRESIESNLETARVAQEITARTHPGATAFEDLHARDYLVYAYLQLGQDSAAAHVLESLKTATRFDEPSLIAAHALAAIPARFALERRDWAAASQLEPPAVDLPWDDFPFVRAITRYAHAIGAARSGDPGRARGAVGELQRLQAASAENPPPGPYDWAGWVKATHLAARAWLAHAESDSARALRFMREAADLEETVGKHAVTPGPVLPAREQLGDLLLELGRPQDALAAFQAALRDAPRRLNGLKGAARAARMAGQTELDRKYAQELSELCKPSDCKRAVSGPM